MMAVTCYYSGKDTLESYSKQVNTGKNDNEIFEENVITYGSFHVKPTNPFHLTHMNFANILSNENPENSRLLS